MRKFLQRLTLCSLAGLTISAQADISLYDRDNKKLAFYLEFAAGTFFGNNSYFGESESFNGANTDSWTEGAFELGFNGETPVGKGALFGVVTGIYTRTWGDDASGLTVGLPETHEFDLEQAHIGWRSGDTIESLDEDALSIQYGHFDYVVGTGLLLADGNSDGGERGGWWMSARKTFRNSFLTTLKSGAWKLEGFYLENKARFDGIEGHGYGGNFEYEFANAGLNTGLLYIKVPDQTHNDGEFVGHHSWALRGDWATTKNLGFSGEYVYQSRYSGTHPKGWFLKGAYQWNDTAWTPEFSYRYAHFDGDDLATPGNEGFATIAYGFTDYGSWFQGEITGNYPLGNDNLSSHLLRLRFFPNESLTLNALYYDFTLDQPHIFGESVASTDWGEEINLALDWAATDHLFVIGTFGLLFPGEAAKNWTGGDENWLYFMLYASYKF